MSSILKPKENDDTKKIDLKEILQKVLHYLYPGMKYIIMIVFCIFIFILFYITSFYKSDVIFLAKYKYIMMIVLPLLLLIYLFLRNKENSDLDPTILIGIGGVIVVVMMIIFISNIKKPSVSSINSIVFGSYIINIILFAIFLVGLAIGYKVLKNSAKKLRGWPGFIVNFLFFIPCLISDLIDYIFLEFKTAPNTVFVLFIIEIILILAYLYVPKLLKYITTKNGLILQEQPVYLNKSTIISNSSIFLLPSSLTNVTADMSSNVFNSNFGLSMWIYVNNMGISIQEEDPVSNSGSILFQIASPNDTNGKPCIRYIGNDKWNFIFSDQLIQVNTLSVNNPTNNNNDNLKKYLIRNSNNVSETLMFLYDASKKNNTTPNTKYDNWLTTETNFKKDTNYIVRYSYSYGISNIPGVTNNKKNIPSISDLLDQINKDYKTYLPTTVKNRKLFKKNESFTLTDMYNMVQSITQTIMYNTKEQYIMKMPSQKWNHIVFNYYENNVDLFINGNLERSMNLNRNPILQLPTDIISVGDDTNGINASICNIIYYNIPMTQTKISQLYNTYFMKNPPI